MLPKIILKPDSYKLLRVENSQACIPHTSYYTLSPQNKCRKTRHINFIPISSHIIHTYYTKKAPLLYIFLPWIKTKSKYIPPHMYIYSQPIYLYYIYTTHHYDDDVPAWQHCLTTVMDVQYYYYYYSFHHHWMSSNVWHATIITIQRTNHVYKLLNVMNCIHFRNFDMLIIFAIRIVVMMFVKKRKLIWHLIILLL